MAAIPTTTSAASPLVPTKETDFLDEDAPLRGQNYVCLSFLSPEDVMRDKEVFYFGRYLDSFGKDVQMLIQNLRNKYPDDKGLFDTITENYKHVWAPDELQAHYRFFKSTNGASLESEFQAQNDFRTSVRGIKVRGVYDTVEEAKNRAQVLKRMGDKFDIFVGQVGCWCPWSPDPNDMKDVEYAETQLNTLMKRYQDNMSLRDMEYEDRKRAKMEAAERENQERKAALGAGGEGEAAADLAQADPWMQRRAAEEDGTEPKP